VLRNILSNPYIPTASGKGVHPPVFYSGKPENRMSGYPADDWQSGKSTGLQRGEMAVTLKYRIIEFLSKDISALKSISDIAKGLGVAYSHAHMSVMALEKEGALKIQKIGNVSVCKLELKSNAALAHLSAIESIRTSEWLAKNPQAAKIIDKIELVKDSVHSVLVKNNNITLIVPEKITGTDFSMFRNRTILNHNSLKSKRQYYKEAIVLHGAEKFWSMMGE
jgi:hypothetical protein